MNIKVAKAKKEKKKSKAGKFMISERTCTSYTACIYYEKGTVLFADYCISYLKQNNNRKTI